MPHVSGEPTKTSERSISELIEHYVRGADLLRAAVAGMTPEHLRARPIVGTWSTLEVVCHVADCDQFHADRMKRTVAMNRPLLMSADGDRYPETLFYHDHDLEEELQLIEATRRQMARTLRLIAADAWSRPAVHSEAGLVTLRDLLTNAVDHIPHHIAFIERKRAALK